MPPTKQSASYVFRFSQPQIKDLITKELDLDPKFGTYNFCFLANSPESKLAVGVTRQIKPVLDSCLSTCVQAWEYTDEALLDLVTSSISLLSFHGKDKGVYKNGLYKDGTFHCPALFLSRSHRWVIDESENASYLFVSFEGSAEIPNESVSKAE